MTRHLDIRRLRAEILTGVLVRIRSLVAETPDVRTVYLGCDQRYSDEAHDAVHATVLRTRRSIPEFEPYDEQSFDVAYADRLYWPDSYKTWNDNRDAPYAFAAMCNEQGWTETWGDSQLESAPSPLLVVQHDAGRMHVTWHGALHRPWLDFPGAMQDRDERWSEEPTFAPDPPSMALEGAEHELQAQVFADPTDHGARDVLRDLWMQRDDPRGELTALSASPSLSPAERARAAELVLTHGRAWLGPLQAVVPLAGALFGHGPFARKLVVYAADADAFARVADAPEWATVEAITFANQSYRRLTPAMRGLRAVGPLALAELAPLATGAWRIEELDLDLASGGELAQLVRRAWPLRRLALRLDEHCRVDLGPLQAAEWWPALERLELWLPGDAVGVPDLPPPQRVPVLVDRLFHELHHLVPRGATLAIGQLRAGQRAGWMLAGDSSGRRLELRTPDARHGNGARLAAATGLVLPETWEAPTDDWLTFGLGVAT